MSISTLLRAPAPATSYSTASCAPYEEDNRIFTPEQMDEYAEYLTATAARHFAA